MKTCIVPVCSVSPLHTQSELNGSSYNIRHTDHSEVVRVAVVYRAFLAHICREEGLAVDEDHLLLIPTKARVIASPVDHAADVLCRSRNRFQICQSSPEILIIRIECRSSFMLRYAQRTAPSEVSNSEG